MSISREVTVWCDKCQDWSQRSGVTVAQTRRELREIGWRRRRGEDGKMIDLCPPCAKTVGEGEKPRCGNCRRWDEGAQWCETLGRYSPAAAGTSCGGFRWKG